MEIKIYQKKNSLSVGKLLKESFKDIYSSRFLARQLAVRDIKAQYRQSYLGILWAFVNPITTAFVWIFLTSSGTIRLTDTGIPYPVYAFTGTLLWSIMTESINSPINSTNGARSILSKINFPKEALIISGIYKLLFNSSIKIVLLFIFIPFFEVGFHGSIFWFPLTIIAAVLFGTTIGLFLTPLGMLYKDISRMISFGLQFLMYATPVVYAIPKGGFMRVIMEWNPFTPFILVARDTVTGMPAEHITYFLIIIGCCVPLLFLGLVFYRISIPVIVERLSA